MSRRRILLSAVAAVLTLTALLAIAILLFGRFGDTEGRILGTTLFLALFGLLSLPAAVLLDQERHGRLAALVLTLAVAGFALATTGIWIGDPPTALGKLTGTVIALGVASTQTAALAARRRETDPDSVRMLFVTSTVLGYALAAAVSVAVWAEAESQLLARLLGASVVLDVLLVSLQPVLALLRRPQRRYVLHLRLDESGELDIAVEASTLSQAAARAIDEAEEAGREVVAVEVVDGRFDGRAGRASVR
jgi:MFS family permease